MVISQSGDSSLSGKSHLKFRAQSKDSKNLLYDIPVDLIPVVWPVGLLSLFGGILCFGNGN